MDDIRPYTCILDDCQSPDNFYMLRSDWDRHIQNDHSKSWQCLYCSAPGTIPRLFTTADRLTQHIRDSHADAASEEHIASAVITALRPTPFGVDRCPLCDATGASDSGILLDHIAEHIHSFALQSLPWPDDVQNAKYFSQNDYFDDESDDISQRYNISSISERDSEGLPSLKNPSDAGSIKLQDYTDRTAPTEAEATRQRPRITRFLAKALSSYEAKEEHELSFRIGDLLTIIYDFVEDWWGAIDAEDHLGIVPRNRLKEVPLARALFSFEAGENNELSFREGDMLAVVEKPNEDWWFAIDAENQGGLVPSNYLKGAFFAKALHSFEGGVDDMWPFGEGDTMTVANDEGQWWVAIDAGNHRRFVPVPGRYFDKKVFQEMPFLAKALYPFEGAAVNELPFRKGDTLTVKEARGGWWLATDAENRTAWVPGDYLEIITSPVEQALSDEPHRDTELQVPQKGVGLILEWIIRRLRNSKK